MWRASYHISPPAPSISRCVGGNDEEKAAASTSGGAGAPRPTSLGAGPATWAPAVQQHEGSVVELERLAGDPLDILANGVNIARGEVVMVGERFGIRFTEVTNPENRVKKL